MFVPPAPFGAPGFPYPTSRRAARSLDRAISVAKWILIGLPIAFSVGLTILLIYV